MADDIEQILQKVESQLLNENNRRYSIHRVSSEARSEVDPLVSQLLDDLQASPTSPLFISNHPPPGTSSSSALDTATSTSVRGSKCFPLLLGAADTPSGLSTLQNPRACDLLVCTSCDRSVVVMLHSCWLPGTDSLFLRQAAVHPAHLSARLKPLQGARAYACQCHSLSVTQATQPIPQAMPWVCSRH